VVTGAARVEERTVISRTTLKTAMLPRGAGKIPQALRAFVPRAEERSAADLAVRIKVAAAQAQHSHDWPSRMRRMKDRA